MALLIPPKPQGSASPSVIRMFQALRRLPDTFTVWFALHRELPHFFVLWREKHGFLIQVAATTQQLAETALQRSFLDEAEVLTPENLGLAERETLDRFLESARRTAGIELPPHFPLRRLVVFPNVEQSTIDQIELLRATDSDTAFLGMKQSGDADFARRLEALAAAPLAEPELHALRKEFTPESVIHESCRPLPLARRAAGTAVIPDFLDFAQESLVKLDLELSPEAERAANELQARLVTGPAGSGKSLVLLHRAVQAARLHRGSRLLVLTHNRPINGELRRRFETMLPGCREIEWKTFFMWAARFLPNERQRILATWQTERALEALKPTVPGLEKLTPAFLAEEIHYLRDLGIRSEADYLALDRSGRAAGLTRERRSAVWGLLESYRREMQQRGETDWHERALDFETLALQRPWVMTQGYDFIFIDEAQFFAKCWFAPVIAALRPGGQLFLSADPTQGFLKRRLSWLAAGIDVRGRSTRLSKPYRTTRRILAFATRLYQLHHPDPRTSEETDLADPANLSSIAEAGTWPEIVTVTTPRQEIDEAVARIVRIRDERPDLAGRILLLHADSNATGDLTKALQHRLGPDQVRDAKDLANPGGAYFCTVSTLNAATGLEAAIVLVLGLNRLLEKENDPRLDAPALSDLRADHAKMFYVASTRAARRLVVYARSEEFTDLLRRAIRDAGGAEGSDSI